MANTNTEQKVEAVVFKGERRYMTDAIAMFVRWGVQMDQIVVEDDVTHIYVQAPKQAIKALHKALKADGTTDYLGLN
jgi:hypothetical protein